MLRLDKSLILIAAESLRQLFICSALITQTPVSAITGVFYFKKYLINFVV